MCCQILYSQNIEGIILDSITKKPIELVNIFFTETYYGTFTDVEGKFQLKTKENKSDLLITTIGYESKKIKLSDFENKNDNVKTFYLKPKLETLEEIILKRKSNWLRISIWK
jgi:hypothetical protein